MFFRPRSLKELVNLFRVLIKSIKAGFDITDTWDLDHAHAKWISKRLRYLSKNTHGHPSELCDSQYIKTHKLLKYKPTHSASKEDTAEMWSNILNAIAEGFEVVIDPNSFGMGSLYINDERYIEAMRLFQLFYSGLWD